MERVVVRPGRTSLTLPFVCAAFVAAGIAMIIEGEDVAEAAFVTAFFSLGLIIPASNEVRRRRGRPVLIIDDDGFEDHSSMVARGTRVAWTDLRRARVMTTEGQRLLALDLSPDALTPPRPGTAVNRALGFGAVTIAEQALPFPLERLIELFQERCPWLMVDDGG